MNRYFLFLLCLPVFLFCSLEQEVVEQAVVVQEGDTILPNPASPLRRLSAIRREAEKLMMQKVEQEIQAFESNASAHELMMRLLAMVQNFRKERDSARVTIHKLRHQGKPETMRQRRVTEQQKSRMFEEARQRRKRMLEAEAT